MNYRIETISCGAYMENAYLLCAEGRADALLIDPGDGLPALRAAIAASGRALGGILLTHGHFDHMLAAQALAQAHACPTYIRAEDAELLCDAAKNAYDPHAATLPCPQGFAAEPLGERVDLCGISLEVIHTPGHTRGSVCYYDAQNARLFSGDTLFCMGFGRMDLYGGSQMAMRRSLRALLALPAETRVFCGHGPETRIGDERTRYGI